MASQREVWYSTIAYALGYSLTWKQDLKLVR